MATVSFTYPAPDGETLDPDSYDTAIGRTTDLDRGQGNVFQVEVTGAVVAEDGLSVEITLETDAELSLSEEALIGFALRRQVG